MIPSTQEGQSRLDGWPLQLSGLSPASGGQEFRVRPYGTESVDLGVDFLREQRPSVVTTLLANCLSSSAGSPLTCSELWDWPVAERTQGLLAVAAATVGVKRMATVNCPVRDCGEVMELDLELTVFRQPCPQRRFEFHPDDDVALEVRLPTGADQLKYLSEPDPPLLTLAEALTVSGLEKSRFEAAWMSSLEKELAKRDPLTGAQLSIRCPYCGAENSVEFDLEGHLLREFERVQRRLLEQIHRLASAYHWSEAQIASLPEQRREYYLERVSEEVNE